MSRPGFPPRHRVILLPQVAGDIAALATDGRRVIDAAERAIEDLADGRVVGKRLGARPGTGDLSGLARVKFDVPGGRRQRFRLVYRDVDDDVREVVTIGRREQDTVHRFAAERLAR